MNNLEQVELHIVDDKNHLFKLSGFEKKTETNLLISGLEPIGILQYKAKCTSDGNTLILIVESMLRGLEQQFTNLI
jgi:hypothetical protein